MKITDKMRLDWLIYKGNLWSEDSPGDSLWQAEGHGPGDPMVMARSPRQAIDAAIRASKPKKARGGRA